MTPEDEKKLKKITTFADNPQLAIFTELETVNEHLEGIHEILESMNAKEMPNTDTSKVENLLTQLIEKEKEDISITIEIV